MQLTLALRYLAGRKLRTFLTTLAIVFGVLVIFGMNSMLPAFVQAFQANAMAAASQVDVTITSQTGEPFPASVLNTVAGVDGVRAASGTLERSIGLQPDYFDRDPSTPDRVSAVNLVGIVPEQARSIAVYQVLSGRFLQDGDTNSAVITESLADDARLKLGDVLDLLTPSGVTHLTVIGLLPQRLLPGNEEVLVNLPEAQNLFAAAGQINVIEADFNSSDAARRQAIEAGLRSALGPSYTLGVLQAGAEILANISLAQMIFNVLGIMALLMGGFIIFNTFRTIVVERRRDIGMLRSLGASRGTVTATILLEGLIQGVIGTAAGLLLGYGIAQLMVRGVSALLRHFINISMSGVPLDPSVLLVSIAAGVGITLLAGLLPARAASRVAPLEALRPSVAEVARRRLGGAGFWAGLVMVVIAVAALLTGNAGLIGLGSLLIVVGLILIGPALVEPIARLFGALLAMIFARGGTAQLAEGNLSRQPGRAAITASTTMIALTILVMSASLISSIALSFKSVLVKSLSSDYMLMPPSVSTWGLDVGASPDLADKLRSINGVAVVSTVRFATSKINDQPVGILGIDPPAYQQTSGLTFTSGDAQKAFAELEAGRGMIINGVLAGRAKAKLGDQVKVLTPTGEATYTIAGLATDYLNAKTNTGYISQANIASDFGRTEDVFYQINLKPGADRTAVEASFKEALKPYPQFKLIAGQEYLDQNIGLLNSLFFGMIALVLFLSIPSLIAMVNTLAIGVLERRREIGMLRAVGATRRQVRTVILAEALILAAIGTAFGVIAGVYLGYSSTSAFGAAGFPISYLFPAAGVLLAIASGLIFGALAALIPARQAAGMQIVEALRYE
ncbi:MAG: FtsX-like permease family protein [Omnitrophica WOR_2 bacterium]